MIKFNPNTLDAELVLGDTGTFSIAPKLNGEIMLKEGDKVFFTLKKLIDQTIILQKEITEFEDGVATITIPPEDTILLNPDNYIYDLKAVRSDGNVDTLIPGKPFAYFALKRGVK